jgi:hypothetical protein
MSNLIELTGLDLTNNTISCKILSQYSSNVFKKRDLIANTFAKISIAQLGCHTSWLFSVLATIYSVSSGQKVANHQIGEGIDCRNGHYWLALLFT